MKINGMPDARSFDPIDRNTGQPRTTTAVPTGSASSERVQISELSSQLASLEQQLASGEEFDAAKVEAIKKAIQDGSFSINAEAIADRLIAGTLDLQRK